VCRYAADMGFLRIVVELLNAGADVQERKRATGNTALHVASQNGHCAAGGLTLVHFISFN
jgi:ankyrin repeat protein